MVHLPVDLVRQRLQHRAPHERCSTSLSMHVNTTLQYRGRTFRALPIVHGRKATAQSHQHTKTQTLLTDWIGIRFTGHKYAGGTNLSVTTKLHHLFAVLLS